MISYEQQSKLQDIVRGAILEGDENRCTTFRNLLCQSFGTSPTVKNEFESRAIIKKRQESFLKTEAKVKNLWLESLPEESIYLTRGGEAEVYLAKDKLNVIKVNNAVYYASWMEYFNSILIHNILFPFTCYSLLGFMNNDAEDFCIVLEQPFIEGEQAKLEEIGGLLLFNGFTNIKRQDYYNDSLGLLLEDMHDENVVAKGGLLLFIDTVFYIMGSKTGV